MLAIKFAAVLLIISISATSQQVSELEKQTIFDNTKKEFSQHYHYKEHIDPTIRYLNEQWKAGRYKKINQLNAFTDLLAKDLRHFSKDPHLNYFYDNAEIAKQQQAGPQLPGGLIQEKFLNNGLNKVEILPGDVGYIRLQAFGAIDELLPGTFSFVQNTNALIIDLRDNSGGMLSNIVASYLLPEDSVHLITIKWNSRTDSIFTRKHLEGPRYLDKPVYLLTSKATFSSAEEFAYDLQQLKRVTIVGDTTGGGANPGGIVGIHTFSDGARLGLFIPMGHVINAVSGKNWEGTGVIPEVAAGAEEALTIAHTMALQKIAESEKNEYLKKKYLEIKDSVRK